MPLQPQTGPGAASQNSGCATHVPAAAVQLGFSHSSPRAQSLLAAQVGALIPPSMPPPASAPPFGPAAPLMPAASALPPAEVAATICSGAQLAAPNRKIRPMLRFTAPP